MRAPFTPIEALPGEPAPARPQRDQIDAEIREFNLSLFSKDAAAIGHFQITETDQRAVQLDTEASGQMVVTASREADRIVTGGSRTVARRGGHRQGLERLQGTGDLDAARR